MKSTSSTILPLSGRLLASIASLSLLASCVEPADDSASDLSLSERRMVEEIFDIEDSRPTDERALRPIRSALESRNATIQRYAVRALGRLEQPERISEIAPLLTADWPEVRAEAAHALAQAAGRDGGDVALEPLLQGLEEERSPLVRGALAQALGRLQLEALEPRWRVEKALIDVASEDIAAEDWAQSALGAARGLEAFVRLTGQSSISDESIQRLLALSSFGLGSSAAPETAELAARIRRLATAALSRTGGLALGHIDALLSDPDAEVRRLAVLALQALDDSPNRTAAFEQALADENTRVRWQALQATATLLPSLEVCRQATRTLEDPNDLLALLGIDLTGEHCDPRSGVAERLEVFIATLPNQDQLSTRWHRGAHALVALAKINPEVAARRLEEASSHPIWQVRMYVARGAAHSSHYAVLERLAADQHPNVAERAIAELSSSGASPSEALLTHALSRADYQLLRTAALALEGVGTAASVPHLFATLDRLTDQKRETSRDTRAAILDRIRDLGTARARERLVPYLEDFDPPIALLSAEILGEWTGEAHVANPRPLARTEPPSFDELEKLSRTRVTLELSDRGEIELQLLPFEAPTNAARFVRLAGAGSFDGSTFHRVVPNFVIQGGSPGANEYAGDGPFTRDELTDRSHLRGTVGISTRGRDTGDAQLFINLVDNVRLDHDYTIFAVVVRGMEVVDRVIEGDVIRRISLSEARLR